MPLERLELSGTEITDEGMKHFSKPCFQSLKELKMFFSRITHEGVKYLAPIPSLESFTLGVTIRYLVKGSEEWKQEDLGMVLLNLLRNKMKDPIVSICGHNKGIKCIFYV
jgi:hypothetical protein